MKLPLSITLTLLLILQTFQQVTTQIPDDWKRSDETTDNNGEQTFSEEIAAQGSSSKEDIQSNEDAQAKPESNEGQTFGSIYYSQGEQNSTKLDQSPEQSAEEASSIATTLPPMIALNSSSELSDTSAESMKLWHRTQPQIPPHQSQNTQMNLLLMTHIPLHNLRLPRQRAAMMNLVLDICPQMMYPPTALLKDRPPQQKMKASRTKLQWVQLNHQYTALQRQQLHLPSLKTSRLLPQRIQK